MQFRITRTNNLDVLEIPFGFDDLRCALYMPTSSILVKLKGSMLVFAGDESESPISRDGVEGEIISMSKGSPITYAFSKGKWRRFNMQIIVVGDRCSYASHFDLHEAVKCDDVDALREHLESLQGIAL
jgi:hypothetical protein